MADPPTASVSETDPTPRAPIGQVSILVYAWSSGQTEIRVRLPDEARGPGSSQAAKRSEFASLVLAELQRNADVLEG